MENKKSRSKVDYWDIIFNRCDWCRDNQLWDERTLENYMRLKRTIDKWDDEWISREYDEDMF